jgi:type I restriction enzyme S subunit
MCYSAQIKAASRHMERVMFDTARGAIGQVNINSREPKAFSLPLPPLDLQVKFEEQCRSVLAFAAQQTAALAKAESTSQAILARAFNGGPAVAAQELKAAVA